MQHLLEIDDLSRSQLLEIMERSSSPVVPSKMAPGIAMLFEMSSARTRNSVEMAAAQLGAHPVYIEESEVGLDTRESVEDVVRTLGSYYSIVCARVHSHRVLERMAATDVVPVVNLLSAESHPMQALADILTIHQDFGPQGDLTLTYVGYPGNVWKSLAMASGLVGMKVRLATPKAYWPGDDVIDRLKRCGTDLTIIPDPSSAVEGADVVYTDRWISMSDTEAPATRRANFNGFTVNESLMAKAADHATFMHCLPAKRGEEVTASVIDGPASRVWRQAQNRMHTARGVFSWLLGTDRAAAVT